MYFSHERESFLIHLFFFYYIENNSYKVRYLPVPPLVCCFCIAHRLALAALVSAFNPHRLLQICVQTHPKTAIFVLCRAVSCQGEGCENRSTCEFLGPGNHNCTCIQGFYGDNCEGRYRSQKPQLQMLDLNLTSIVTAKK